MHTGESKFGTSTCVASGFDTENAALAMLNMSRAESQDHALAAATAAAAPLPDEIGSAGSPSAAARMFPTCRKALSDSNIDAQLNIGVRLQQSLSRQVTLERELTVGRGAFGVWCAV